MIDFSMVGNNVINFVEINFGSKILHKLLSKGEPNGVDEYGFFFLN
ncbi:hypothetical protein SDC9_137350 [bioreactor metagenome]|uniref:Uncharacterized protein n=1 Tax=bioreactor metagenome TaxID=1076179 RepID=A0A645DLQ4_9ZZZZ